MVRANEFADVVLAERLSNKAIARHLGISVHTAKFHVRALIDKLTNAQRCFAKLGRRHAAGARRPDIAARLPRR